MSIKNGERVRLVIDGAVGEAARYGTGRVISDEPDADGSIVWISDVGRYRITRPQYLTVIPNTPDTVTVTVEVPRWQVDELPPAGHRHEYAACTLFASAARAEAAEA